VYYEEFKDTPTPQIVPKLLNINWSYRCYNIIADIERLEKKSILGLIIRALWFQLVQHMGLHILGGASSFKVDIFAILMKHFSLTCINFFGIRSGYYLLHIHFPWILHIKDRPRKYFPVVIYHLWNGPLEVYLYECFMAIVWLFEGIKKAFGLFGTDSWFGNKSL